MVCIYVDTPFKSYHWVVHVDPDDTTSSTNESGYHTVDRRLIEAGCEV